jgi:hypothetical protein
MDAGFRRFVERICWFQKCFRSTAKDLVKFTSFSFYHSRDKFTSLAFLSSTFLEPHQNPLQSDKKRPKFPPVQQAFQFFDNCAKFFLYFYCREHSIVAYEKSLRGENYQLVSQLQLRRRWQMTFQLTQLSLWRRGKKMLDIWSMWLTFSVVYAEQR